MPSKILFCSLFEKYGQNISGWGKRAACVRYNTTMEENTIE